MERIAPAGDVYQAGTLSGNPLAVAAGLATLAQLDAAAYERLGVLTDRLAAGFAALAAERPLAGRRGARPGHALLQPRAGRATSTPPAPATRGPRPLLPRHARPRRLPAAVAVRGLVRLPRPRRGDDRPHPRSRRRGARRGAAGERPGGSAATLAAQLRDEDTPISPHVVDPAAAPTLGAARRRRPARRRRARRVRAGGRGGPRGLPPPLRRAAPARRPRRRPRPARRRLPLRARPRPPRRPRRRPRGQRPQRPDQPLRPAPRRGRRRSRSPASGRPPPREIAGAAAERQLS